jgi:hypothetical protein
MAGWTRSKRKMLVWAGSWTRKMPLMSSTAEFNHGRMLEALQASGSCGFVVGALAMGLATARFFKPK